MNRKASLIELGMMLCISLYGKPLLLPPKNGVRESHVTSYEDKMTAVPVRGDRRNLAEKCVENVNEKIVARCASSFHLCLFCFVVVHVGPTSHVPEVGVLVAARIQQNDEIRRMTYSLLVEPVNLISPWTSYILYVIQI